MEELLTTVILVCFNVALDANGAFTPKPNVPTYYELGNRNNITEVETTTLSSAQHAERINNWKKSL